MREPVWGKRQAQWYSEALRYSDYPDKVLAVIRPLVHESDSLLDIGAGTGGLCLPLADFVREIVALDASAAMLDEMGSRAALAGLGNVRPIEGAWEERERDLGVFDSILCANVPSLLTHIASVLPSLQRHARRHIILISGTSRNANRFFLPELWPLVHQRQHPRKGDYFGLYRDLYRSGIIANVVIIDYSFDQPFADIEEAISFWKHHLRLTGKQQDDLLKAFLSERLHQWAGRLWALVPKQSAVIWWKADVEK